MTHRTQVETWVRDYERLWRTPGTDGLAQLFTADATYKTSPWAPPIVGLPALAEFWDAERDGPDEDFTLTAQVIAVDGPTAVVRVNVEYLEPGDRWRDLWILELDDHGLCSAFEEWPIAPGKHAQ
ncbi:nuclear transport factor 2 family protein [Promicromonospora kroppenstedtii]|uniref:nuclear transport factor 2 family protein n=1 Tax=Promicromonospora kroppenstedtii TaxID=440482 RepID=UPI0004B31C99|nr:nuclear transport factor 2 family protein [Promicromonospora kroppenstedtii]